MKNDKKNISIYSVLLLVFTMVGCSTTPFKVVSEPDQAEVFIVDSESNVEQPLGKTPLVKTKKELVEQLKDQDNPGGLINVLIKKDGFKTKNIWVPVNAGGSLGTQLTLKLEKTTSSSDEMKTAKEIIDKIFLSQKYAKSNQLERALIEIDKVLKDFPELDRAMTMKGAILYGQGVLKESLKWYEDALNVNPNLQTAIEMSGKIRKKLRLPARRTDRSTKLPRLPASTKKAK